MAASNWAVMAWGTDGKSCTGEVKLGDMSIEIYKSHVNLNLDVQDGKGPIAMRSIYAGDMALEVDDFLVMTKNHIEPEGVFVYVQRTHDYSSETRKHNIEERFFGIGMYGYSDDGEWVGVTEDLVKEFVEWYRGLEYWEMLPKIDLVGTKQYNAGDAFFAEHLGASVEDCMHDGGKGNTPIMEQLLTGGKTFKTQE